MTAEEYIKRELAEGRLTARHIQALTLYYQGAHITLGARDGKPGPVTRGQLEARYPYLFAAPEPGKQRFLRLPLPIIMGASGSRKPVITSSFRHPARPSHDGVDFFYRWQEGDRPDFVGDGGCAGRMSDGRPKWVIPYGTWAHAAAAGTVQIAGMTPTGYRVWVNHGNGYRSGYFHLSRIAVEAGAHVQFGSALGLVGNNPRDNDGNHLHFELSPVEKYDPVDPVPFFEEGQL